MSILPSVFVSYSRADSNSIQYAVRLLEAGGAEVFRDLDDIRFGERWEDVITKRLNDCERVLVFWSKAAQQSEWVGREYQLGLEMGKTVVPILLDDTPLPADLGAFHALTMANFMPKTPRWKRWGGWVLGGLATTALAGVLGFQFLQTNEPLLAPSTSPPVSQQSELAVEQNIERDIGQRSEQGIATGAAMSQGSPVIATDSAGVAEGEASVAESPIMIERPARDTGSGTGSGGEGEIVTYNYQAPPKPAPVRVPKTADAPELSVSKGDDPEQRTHSEQSEHMPSQPVVLLMIAILALLSLCWLAWRRYAQTEQDQLAIGERFVDKVFDDRSS